MSARLNKNNPNARTTVLINVDTKRVRVFDSIMEACYFLRCSTCALRIADEKKRAVRRRDGTDWMVSIEPSASDSGVVGVSDDS